MAFLPGIFGKAATQQPQQPSPANSNGSGGPASQQQQPANGQIAPQAQAAQQQPTQNAGGPQQGTASPLDSFTDFFKPKQRDPNAQAAPTLRDPFLAPLDPAAFKQQVSSANFAAGIPQDTMTKAMSGDPTAFADAINHAAREAFSAAAQLSHGLAEQATRTGLERLDGSLDGRIKNYQLRTQNTTNEALNHPAVAPMLSAVKMQIAQSNPNLSPAEVQNQAEQYFDQMAGVLQGSKQAAQQPANTGPRETDFSSYLN
jgi:hypothetical protein